MAAMPDRRSRAIPFNPLKPFNGYEFADLVASRRCATARCALLTASITRSRKSCEYGFGIPAGLRPANRLNQNVPDSGIPPLNSSQRQPALGLQYVNSGR